MLHALACADRGLVVRRTGLLRWRKLLLVPAVGFTAAVVSAAAVPSSALATTITEFSGGLGGDPGAIVAGPDGNVWFTEAGAIARISPTGAITEFHAGLNPGSEPFDLVLGADGSLWFSDIGATKALGRITPSGVITEHSIGLNPGSVPENVTLGADGNVWFLDLGATRAIGRVTPSGEISEYSGGLNPVSQPNDITTGPDGNVWFTDEGNTKAIGRVTPAGEIMEFSSGLIEPMNSFPNEITAGADGNVWFTDDGTPSAIGKVTPAGAITEFTTGLNSGSAPDSLTAGPDGNVWFADQAAAHRAIGRITPTGTITEFDHGLSTGLPDDITVGADGNLWIEQSMSGGIARITPAGVITEFTAGLNSGAGSESDQIVSGPDGNLWFTDGGTTKAIGRVALELPSTSTPPTPTPITTIVGTPSRPIAGTSSPRPETIKAVVGNQRLTLSSPSLSACTVSTQQLSVTLGSTAIPGSRAAKLRFLSAALFLDRGVAHRRRQIRRSPNGSKKTVTVVTYTANAVLHHASARVGLRLTGLRSGAHTLKVKVIYAQRVTRHRHTQTVRVAKTLTASFGVC
jgi:virginiamycin B lyase